MAAEDQELWDFFASDAAEAIRLIEQSLLELETTPDKRDEINRLYRGLHTLKGNAAFLELSQIEHTAHGCEDLVGLVRDRGLVLDTEMVNLILEALDVLREAVEFAAKERHDVAEADVADLNGRVATMYAARSGGAPEAPKKAPPPKLAPGLPADGVFSEEWLASLTKQKQEPSAPQPEPEPEPAAVPALPLSPARAAAPAAQAAPARDDERSEFLRIDASKVGMLMDLAGELGLACSAVTRHADVVSKDFEGFAAAAHKLELLVREIQTDLSSLRLVPVAPVFSRMKRVVRDAARRTGKKIDFVIRGEDTEIDKVMIDALQDPLVHVLRNAVDHGIEPGPDRIDAGKPEAGKITLSATHQGGEVTIEVRDDGGGLKRDRILARAKERGLCAQYASPTDDEIAEFVFLPGFSTKDTADELSGRGVGMDVLKTTIEGLRGRVRLVSTPGLGSCIRMTMPLTLAFVEAMVVREQDRLFALPIEKVFEVSRISKKDIVSQSLDGRTMLRVHDACVPVLWLHRYWAESTQASESLENRIVVVVQTSRGPLAIPVDDLIGNQQVMLKPLKGVLSGIRAAAGCGMLRTGDVAVALDCEQLHA